jgi:hypothetical protein
VVPQGSSAQFAHSLGSYFSIGNLTGSIPVYTTSTIPDTTSADEAKVIAGFNKTQATAYHLNERLKEAQADRDGHKTRCGTYEDEQRYLLRRNAELELSVTTSHRLDITIAVFLTVGNIILATSGLVPDDYRRWSAWGVGCALSAAGLFVLAWTKNASIPPQRTGPESLRDR